MKFSIILGLFVITALASCARGIVNDTLLPFLTSRAESDCGTFCRFRLCTIGSDGEFIPFPTGFGLPFGMPFTAENPPFVCRLNGPTVGRIIRVRQAKVRLRGGRLIRLARLGRNSLRRKFNPNFFGVRDFITPDLLGFSAIRRAKFRSMDQRNALEGRCVILPMRTFEVIGNDGNVNRIVSTRDRRNCVSFISTGSSTQLKVQLMWNTAVDLDLTLTEPGDDGFEIDFEENKSPNGGFLFEDVALGDCEGNGGARDSVEMVEYSGLSTPVVGTYTINLSQFAACADLETTWYLTVMIGDNTILEKEGTVGAIASGDEAVLFKTLQFTFPGGEVIHETPEINPEG